MNNRHLQRISHRNRYPHKFAMHIMLFMFGAVMGIVAKLLDIHTSNLGNVFSQMSIWILIGTMIAIFSKTRGQAALNVFLFCVGMLITYYITAELTNSVYGMTFIYGWVAFSVCSPVFAWFTWMAKEKDLLGKIISLGVLVVTLTISMVVFDGPRVYDVVIMLVLAYFLLIRKINRRSFLR